ncbi:hypothetical protein B0J11DRAFT_109883 [Dendryphion nanum]|uniref:Uncharacterized protein n=1 Tax=Dendryphion nanum TaxID=256645 RepID=A0A9P9DDR5_9PLEO|nr:hypothetical protein B0J11DRAFT_109883 [Dendryphion nanum]
MDVVQAGREPPRYVDAAPIPNQDHIHAVAPIHTHSSLEKDSPSVEIEKERPPLDYDACLTPGNTSDNLTLNNIGDSLAMRAVEDSDEPIQLCPPGSGSEPGELVKVSDPHDEARHSLAESSKEISTLSQMPEIEANDNTATDHLTSKIDCEITGNEISIIPDPNVSENPFPSVSGPKTDDVIDGCKDISASDLNVSDISSLKNPEPQAVAKVLCEKSPTVGTGQEAPVKKQRFKTQITSMPISFVSSDQAALTESNIPGAFRVWPDQIKRPSSISVPPHLRPGSSRPAPSQPKNHNPGYNHLDRNSQRYRDCYQGGGSGLRTSLLKAQQELVDQKGATANMRASIEAEYQQRTDKVVLDIQKNVLQKLMEIEKEKERLHQIEISLKSREEMVIYNEKFINFGQHQFRSFLEEMGFSRAADLELEQAYWQGFAEGRAEDEKSNAILTAKTMQLHHRETDLDIREQYWKERSRSELEHNLRQEIEIEVESRVAAESYDQGLQGGREVRNAEEIEEAHKQGFIKGYHMFQKHQMLILGLKNGSVAPNSPDVEFLFDQSHPENPFNIGIEVGRRGSIKSESTKINFTKKDSTKKESTKKESTKVNSTKVNPTKIDSAKIESTKTESIKIGSTKTEPTKTGPTKTDSTKIDSTKLKFTKLESSKSAPAKSRRPVQPPRPTLFDELHGVSESDKNTGFSVQGGGQPIDGPIPGRSASTLVVQTTSNAQISYSRPLLRYETSEDEAVIATGSQVATSVKYHGSISKKLDDTPNLIDLY